MSIFQFRLTEDRQRNAFMFETNPVSRDTCGQNHYLLYFMQHWFDIRNKGFASVEVSFYNFPAHLEADRKRIEQCFGQAARVHGLGDGGQDIFFDPVFGVDDWSPGYI